MLKSLRTRRSKRQIALGASDDALVLAYGRGDLHAARQLAEKITPRLVSVAFNLLGDRAEAEDVAQETMLRLWKAAPEWEPGQAQVATWAYRVATNLSIDRIRKRRETVEIGPENEPVDPASDAGARLQDKARQQALYRALGDLPERQATALVLRHFEGLSNPEIGEIMGIGVEAVESLSARGKKALAAILGKRKQELGYGT